MKQYKNNRFTFQTMSLELLDSGENKTKHKRIRTKEEIDYIACCRARKMVKEYMLCNDFNYFCTLTIKAEDTRFHLEKCIELLRKIFSYCKKLDKNFKYLCVIEPHKKGGFHFHFVTNLIPFELIKFTEEDLVKIEKEMKRIAASAIDFKRYVVSKEEAGHCCFLRHNRLRQRRPPSRPK